MPAHEEGAKDTTKKRQMETQEAGDSRDEGDESAAVHQGTDGRASGTPALGDGGWAAAVQAAAQLMLRGGGSGVGGANAGVVATSSSRSNDATNRSPAIDGGTPAPAGGLARSDGSGTEWGAGEEMKLGGRNVLARTESGGGGKGGRITAAGEAVGKMSAEGQAVARPKKSESPTALATYSWGMESRKGGVRETLTATIGDAEMVKVWSNGDVTINSGEMGRTLAAKVILSIVLRVFKVEVIIAEEGAEGNDQGVWQIEHPSGYKQAYSEGMNMSLFANRDWPYTKNKLKRLPTKIFLPKERVAAQPPAFEATGLEPLPTKRTGPNPGRGRDKRGMPAAGRGKLDGKRRGETYSDNRSATDTGDPSSAFSVAALPEGVPSDLMLQLMRAAGGGASGFMGQHPSPQGYAAAAMAAFAAAAAAGAGVGGAGMEAQLTTGGGGRHRAGRRVSPGEAGGRDMDGPPGSSFSRERSVAVVSEAVASPPRGPAPARRGAGPHDRGGTVGYHEEDLRRRIRSRSDSRGYFGDSGGSQRRRTPSPEGWRPWKPEGDSPSPPSRRTMIHDDGCAQSRPSGSGAQRGRDWRRGGGGGSSRRDVREWSSPSPPPRRSVVWSPFRQDDESEERGEEPAERKGGGEGGFSPPSRDGDGRVAGFESDQQRGGRAGHPDRRNVPHGAPVLESGIAAGGSVGSSGLLNDRRDSYDPDQYDPDAYDPGEVTVKRDGSKGHSDATSEKKSESRSGSLTPVERRRPSRSRSRSRDRRGSRSKHRRLSLGSRDDRDAASEGQASGHTAGLQRYNSGSGDGMSHELRFQETVGYAAEPSANLHLPAQGVNLAFPPPNDGGFNSGGVPQWERRGEGGVPFAPQEQQQLQPLPEEWREHEQWRHHQQGQQLLQQQHQQQQDGQQVTLLLGQPLPHQPLPPQDLQHQLPLQQQPQPQPQQQQQQQLPQHPPLLPHPQHQQQQLPPPQQHNPHLPQQLPLQQHLQLPQQQPLLPHPHHQPSAPSGDLAPHGGGFVSFPGTAHHR